MLAQEGELSPYINKSSALAVIDYIVSLSSNVFVPSHRGNMGLPGPALNPQDSLLLTVEFDTSSDPSLADINGNHIGVDVNTVISFASVDAESIE